MVRSAHVAAGEHDNIQSQLMYRLVQVMKGIHKHKSISKPPRVCVPITINITQGIYAVLAKEPASHSNKKM